MYDGRQRKEESQSLRTLHSLWCAGPTSLWSPTLGVNRTVKASFSALLNSAPNQLCSRDSTPSHSKALQTVVCAIACSPLILSSILNHTFNTKDFGNVYQEPSPRCLANRPQTLVIGHSRGQVWRAAVKVVRETNGAGPVVNRTKPHPPI